MNSRERIEAVVNLEAPDRVPVGPLLDHFAATYSGYSNAEIMHDGDARIDAVLKTMKDLGPWDIAFAADTTNAFLLKLGVPVRIQVPGKDLPDNEVHQFEEIEFLSPDDYDQLSRLGVVRFMRNVYKRLYPEDSNLTFARGLLKNITDARKHRKMVEASGAELACSFVVLGSVLEYFSFGRGLMALSLDIYDRPDKLKEVGRIWAKAFTRMAIYLAKYVGSPRIFIGLARSSPALISPDHFQEFVLPDLEYMTHTLVDAGLTPLLHCDTDWTRNFSFFKKLPKKKCILQLDSFSDIFKAKEVLGDHMCLMGDVPATLQAFGEKDEVLSYCKRLIENVGKGGGFILSSGCSIPANAKPENVKAMREAVDQWGWY